jgi:hypothetical protein
VSVICLASPRYFVSEYSLEPLLDARWIVESESVIIHISIWNVSFSILIGQNSVAEWLSG